MKWWSPPKQRQRWHSPDILPSDTDAWGQIFYDLFYVGGAYNLGNVLKHAASPSSPRALLYFFSTGFPAMVMWHDKLHFDARFTTRPGRDVFHRCLEILQLCCVGTALSRIRSVEVESHPCDHIDIFEFAAALLLNAVLTIGRYVEVVACATDGDPGARCVARRDALCRLPPALFLLAATVESGTSYFAAGPDGNDDDWECAANEKPVWYCLLSWASGLAIGYGDQLLCAPKGRRRRIEETSVPLNVHFCMHRYGEWFMLMFGESIMSLLIVEGDNESLNHNLKFYAGILSVTCLAQLHFRGEPAGPRADHALSRSRASHYLYTAWLVPVYSLALVATGVCYKIFLYDYSSIAISYYNDDDGYYHDRRNLGGDNAGNDYVSTDDDHDNNDNSASEHVEEHQQDTAELFTRSLALVLVCTDLNPLLHQGRKVVRDRIGALPRCHLAVLCLSKCALLFFLATVLSALQNDPHFMALFGLGAILLQVAWRRCFRAWQREGIEAPSAADGGGLDAGGGRGSDPDAPRPVHAHARHGGRPFGRVDITPAADGDYPHEIERFESAEAALAKFEQQAIVDGTAAGAGPSSDAAAGGGAIVDSYYELPA